MTIQSTTVQSFDSEEQPILIGTVVAGQARRVLEMYEHHPFRFDEDKAYEDQLVSVLEASPEHPLSAADAPREPGVYVLFRGNVPIYVGKAKDLRSRLNACLKRTANLKGTNVQEVTCRFLTIERKWEVLRAKAALCRRYDPK